MLEDTLWTQWLSEMDGSKRVQQLLVKIQKGTADLSDTALYSELASDLLSDVFAAHMDAMTPAARAAVCYALLEKYHTYITELLVQVQTAQDAQQGLKIAAQTPVFPAGRIATLATHLQNLGGGASRTASLQLGNTAMSFHDDFVRENAAFRDKAGLSAYITRIASGGACSYCAALAGRFRYGDHPQNIFSRHRDCRCTVTYECGRQRQDVWSKRKWEAPEEVTQKKPTVFTQEEAEKLQAEKLRGKGLTKGERDGIIEDSEGQKPITVITDKAIERVPNVRIDGYDDEQCRYIQQQHKELLQYARDKNSSKEVAFVFGEDLSGRKIFTGTDSSLEFGSQLYGKNLVVMHNHPRNGSYSLQDTMFMLSNPSLGSLTIVKNNGAVEILQKTSTFDANKLKTSLSRILKSTIKSGTNVEYDKAIKKFLTEHSKEGGMLKWINS